MNAALAIPFQKNARSSEGIEPRASWGLAALMGSNARRINGGRKNMRNSTAARVTPVVPSTTVGPKKIFNEREIAESFSATIHQFTPAQIATAARVTKDGAKHWFSARRAPSLAKALQMANALPMVQEWLAAEAGIGARDAQAQSVDAVLRVLHGIAARDDAEGFRARQILARATQIEANNDERRDNFVVHDLFQK